MPCGPSPLLETCARRWTSLSRIELGRRFRYYPDAACTRPQRRDGTGSGPSSPSPPVDEGHTALVPVRVCFSLWS